MLALALLSLALGASAQEWPSKPVRIVVPFPPGGGADGMPRALSDRIAEKLGQPVVIENRPGAAGNIGADVVFHSDPDGYTLLAAPAPPLVINQMLYKSLNFDPTKFVPVTVMGAIPNAIYVHPQIKVNSIPELIAYAKANPGKLNYGSQGSGTTSHMTCELFKSMAGNLNITHVPYKGTGPALAAFLGGQVDMICDNLGTTLAHVRAGKVKILAVASKKRVPTLPDVPALDEMLPGFESIAWFGIVGPPGMPPAIAERMSAVVREVEKDPEVQKRFAALSAQTVGNTPAEMAAFMKQEIERWGSVIRAANIHVD
ncbi:MAG TPA: tripartite tricarboxylate transporter substrate binding protein [Burkholderiales bacterium]|nr:tripartite tricarboxylate transporter substrate binding protein [Burkholderiales bacterium]